MVTVITSCEANGCSRSADWAFIGEGGDMYLCAFHGGWEVIEGWVWLHEHDPATAAALLVMACPWRFLLPLPTEETAPA